MIIITNILSLIACFLMFLGGYVKTKKNYFLCNIIQLIFTITCNILAGSIPGCTTNIVSLVKAIVGYRGSVTTAWQFFFILMNIVFTIFSNNIGLVGLLPPLASIISILFLKKNILVIKYANIVCFLLWTVHDFIMKMFFFGISDIVYICITVVSIIQIKKKAVIKNAD